MAGTLYGWYALWLVRFMAGTYALWLVRFELCAVIKRRLYLFQRHES